MKHAAEVPRLLYLFANRPTDQSTIHPWLFDGARQFRITITANTTSKRNLSVGRILPNSARIPDFLYDASRATRAAQVTEHKAGRPFFLIRKVFWETEPCTYTDVYARVRGTCCSYFSPAYTVCPIDGECVLFPKPNNQFSAAENWRVNLTR